MNVTFYTLSSSAYPDDVRYVGKTRQTIKRRLQGHICSAQKAAKEGYCTNHNYNWINQQLTKDGELIREWLTGAEAARELKLDKANLNACCKGKRNLVEVMFGSTNIQMCYLKQKQFKWI